MRFGVRENPGHDDNLDYDNDNDNGALLDNALPAQGVRRGRRRRAPDGCLPGLHERLGRPGTPPQKPATLLPIVDKIRFCLTGIATAAGDHP